ncbi:unnamed protein product [Bemisia tabaci]|uniref:Uncharacterized protein n=1 Tax=Bemisia tabaci TaxID=7038 RepID=A0A9P0AN60_BEMTA|nr:unnamed protein product [Bemisia tabaci]
MPTTLSSLPQMPSWRFTGLPADTHRIGAAFEAASRLMKSSLAALCPSPRDFISIPPIVRAITANRAGHHIGAAYLTGQPRVAYNDSDSEQSANRAGHHIGAAYLTGQPRVAYNDSDSEQSANRAGHHIGAAYLTGQPGPDWLRQLGSDRCLRIVGSLRRQFLNLFINK